MQAQVSICFVYCMYLIFLLGSHKTVSEVSETTQAGLKDPKHFKNCLVSLREEVSLMNRMAFGDQGSLRVCTILERLEPSSLLV